MNTTKSALTGRRKYRKQLLTGKLILMVQEKYTRRWRDAEIADMRTTEEIK